MSDFNRRNFLKAGRRGRGVAAPAPRLAGAAAAQCDHTRPRRARKLRVLRWKPLRAGRRSTSDRSNTKKFTEKTGIEVRVDNESWEDMRPKAAVAANVGAGPDIIIGTIDDAHQVSRTSCST